MKKKTPHGGGASKGAELFNSNAVYHRTKETSPKLTQTSRVLLYFFSGVSMNKYDAEDIGDHSLNSTVSTLSNTHGIKFIRKREKVPTRFGKPASVTRYRLAPESKDAARRFLEARGALSDQGQ